jgi:hypothetical protein
MLCGKEECMKLLLSSSCELYNRCKPVLQAQSGDDIELIDSLKLQKGNKARGE